MQSRIKYITHNGKQRLEHRVIMEKIVGRELTRDEIVHHINLDPRDNRPENLMLMNQSDHVSYHIALNKRGIKPTVYHINMVFDDAPHAMLKELKTRSGLSWEMFFLDLAGIDSKGNAVVSQMKNDMH